MRLKYFGLVSAAASKTPSTRNRVVDAWRVVALAFVVFGHWISASIWVTDDGTVKALNTLEWIPNGDYWTWLFQVMPIFFLVGGYANAVALERDNTNAGDWILARVRRLYTPVVPLIVVWVGLVLALRPFVTDNVLHTGTLSATIPLWFVAVYLTVIVIAPITYRWWRSWGPWSVLALGAAAITVDVVRFQLDIESIGWLNYIFVWAFLHQVGYWWREREISDLRTPPRVGLALVVAGLALLAMTTTVGWYPVAMVTIPGGGTTNMIPPTFANGFLGIAQVGLIILTMARMRNMTKSLRVWTTVVAASASMMTIYLWHLTALSLVGAAGIFIANGWLFSFEPGSGSWWLMRVPFFTLLAIVTIGLIGVFGRFEHAIDSAPSLLPKPVVWFGIACAIASVSLMAFVGIVTRDATINWYIPAVALVGAGLTGSIPRRRRSLNPESSL